MTTDFFSERLRDLRAAVAEILGTAVDVKIHRGAFDLEELTKISQKLPAAFISLNSFSTGAQFDECEQELKIKFGLSLITKDKVANNKVAETREAQQHIFLSALMQALPQRRFKDADRLKLSTAKNVFQGHAGQGGVQIWSLMLEQDAHCSIRPVETGSLEEFYVREHQRGELVSDYEQVMPGGAT